MCCAVFEVFRHHIQQTVNGMNNVRGCGHKQQRGCVYGQTGATQKSWTLSLIKPGKLVLIALGRRKVGGGTVLIMMTEKAWGLIF